MHANSAKKPRWSVESTVRILHARAYPNEDFLPVYPRKLEVIAAILKVANYRAASNYLYMVKELHVKFGAPWSDLLAWTLKSCIRSCEPLPFVEFASAVTSSDPVANYGPVGFRNLAVVAVFHLREIEV
eukprot:2283277-Amphidinium_carterae.1